MCLNKYDVAWVEHICSDLNRCGYASGQGMGDSSDVGIRTYSSNAEVIMIATNNSSNCGTVISRIQIVKLGAANNTTLVLSEILMRKTPSTLDVNDPYTRAAASRHRPRKCFCVYPTYTWGFQILLAELKVRGNRGRFYA